MKEVLLLAWRTNNEKNLLLLKNTGGEKLAFSLVARGRNVGEQLAHLHNVRTTWAEAVAKAVFQKSFSLSKEATLTIDVQTEAINASAVKITEVINLGWKKEGKLPSFKAGLIPFLTYLISHESHHRGNMMLTLKQSGFKLPDALRWGLWGWNSLPTGGKA